MLARVEQERLESLKYDKAVIYIKCVDDSDDSKAELTTEVIYNVFHYFLSMYISHLINKIKGKNKNEKKEK